MNRQEMSSLLIEGIESGIRKKAVCSFFGISIRTLQRWAKNPEGTDGRKSNRFTVHNALSPDEIQCVIDTVCNPEFRDKSPNQIVPILAEKGLYIASESTIYRVLRQAGLLKHRSKSKAPERKRPEEIIANAPNQVWTWDITYMLSNIKGIYFYLYLILDIWDRSIVGWSLHEQESGKHAADLINATCLRHEVNHGKLTVHQDNGAPMISSEFLAALSNWGYPSYSRPGVSDDNPYSESQFRTLKYRPEYPNRFETMEEARGWIEKYVSWYNSEHLHSGIGFVTPHDRREGKDFNILENRKVTYEKARKIHPERWSRGIRKWSRPETVALNPRNRKMDRQQQAA